VLRDIGLIYRDHWMLLIPLAALILVPQAVADAVFGDIEIKRVESPADVLKLASVPASLAINLGGEALYAGITAAVVVRWRDGHDLAGLREIARSILYGRLIVLDIMLAIGTVVGLVLLVIPGLLFYAYLYVAPAMIEINGLTIREAIRESFELVKGNFWRVLAFATAVLVGTEAAGAVLESPVHGVSGEAVFNLGIEALLEPLQALATVVLAISLMELHGRPVPGTARSSQSQP
jgi:hypothetical protein